MSIYICSFFMAMLMLIPQNLVQDKIKKYEAIDAYEIRPGIIIMPQYSMDGQICEIGIEKIHYTSGKIRLNPSLSLKEINEIVDELVPEKEKGLKINSPSTDLITQIGSGITQKEEYENISVHIINKELSSNQSNSVIDNVVAIIRWKNRQCQ